MTDRVGDSFLGDPECRQLDVGGRSPSGRVFDAHVDGCHAPDPTSQPFECGPHAQIVEQRQPKVGR